MRLPKASRANATAVALSAGLKQSVQNLMDNPVDYMISAGFSAGTFMLVKSLAIVALGPLVLGATATPIIAGMLTAALITGVRATGEAEKQRDERVAALQANSANPPTMQQLADAQKINASAIIASAFKHGLFSGLIGAFLGHIASEAFMGADEVTPDDKAPETLFVGDEAKAFKQEFVDQLYAHRDGPWNYDHRIEGTNLLGAYGINVDDLEELGYYDDPRPEADQDLTIKDEYWTGKGGIDSTQDFYDAHGLQDQIILDELNGEWAKVVEYGLDQKFTGQTVSGVEITPERLLAGVHLYGLEPIDGVDPKDWGGFAGMLQDEITAPNQDKFFENTPAKLLQPFKSFPEFPYEIGSEKPIIDITALAEASSVSIEERTDQNYTVITVTNPDEIFLHKDKLGDGIITEFEDDLLVINGPLFQDGSNYGVPDGGYIMDHKTQGGDPTNIGGLTNPNDPKFHPAGKPIENFADNNGIMGQKENGEMFLMTYDEWRMNPIPENDVKWAFQNGPILLDQDHDYRGQMANHNPHDPNTAPLMIDDKPAQRTAMGYTEKGDLVIIHSKDPTNFHQLGSFMAKEKAVDAMFLDGTNVGYIKDGVTHGKILDGSTTFHIQGQGGGRGV